MCQNVFLAHFLLAKTAKKELNAKMGTKSSQQ